MIVRENPQIADEYKQRIADVVEGRRPFTQRERPPRDYSIWHLTEGTTLCPESDRLQRTISPLPPQEFRTILKFFMGQAFEDCITTPCRVQKDGVSGEIDDYKLGEYLRELKCTHDSREYFKPKDWWVKQIMGYNYLVGENRADLIVLFWADNLMSYTPWGIKEIEEVNGRPKKWNGSTYFNGLKYNPIDIKAWSYEFTTAEIEDNWKTITDRIEQLKIHIKLKQPMSKDLIEAVLLPWMCNLCRWKPEYCWYWKKYVDTEGEGAMSDTYQPVGRRAAEAEILS